MIEALKRTKSKSTIYAVATVQEEVGLKGARVAAYGLDPDVAIAADVTIPGDHPGIEKKDAPIEMGKGPVVVVADASGRGIIATPQVIEWLAGTAREFEIPIQLEASDGGTTDATSIYLTKTGIPTGVISVATRYIHSPVEVLCISDIDKAADLMARCLETAGRKSVDNLKAMGAKIGVNVDTIVRIGAPANTVIDTAGAEKADLIVMGSHGESGASKLLIGSVVQKVLYWATIPVLVVR
jgi:putative aminopeptidase FrvX